MSLLGKITSKGQTTVPLAIRERLGVKPGDRLEYIVGEDGRITLRKAPGLESLRGILKSEVRLTTEELAKAIEDARAARADEIMARGRS
jgi:antitoxin PrlF